MTSFFEKDIERIFNELSRPFFGLGGFKDFAPMPGCPDGTKSYSFGYAITMGPDGKIAIKKFGDSNPVDGCVTHNTDSTGVREPIVDTIVDEKKTELKLIAEMPGVEKQNVKVTVEENKTVDLSAENGEKKYHVRVPLKHKVIEDSAKATYKNGILQLVFKLVDETPASKQIEID